MAKKRIDDTTGPANPARRDMLRKATYLAAGVTALSSGAVTFLVTGADAAAATGTVVRREISDLYQNHPDEYKKFQEAVKALKALPNTDPASWFSNGDIHNLFCSTLPYVASYQVHFGWFFLPWHRAYLYFTEKKLQAAIGDNTLGLPYWDWSVSRTLPAAYTGADNPLNDLRRFIRTDPPGLTDKEVSLDAMLLPNFFSSWPGGDKPPAPSFGGPSLPYPADWDVNNAVNGTFEATPHGPVHNYVGGVTTTADGYTDYGDMAVFATAAQDPAFFGHHCNLDRIWESWRSDPKRLATEPAGDPSWADHDFWFTDAKGNPVPIRVKDVLKLDALGVRYDKLQPFPGTTVTPMAAMATKTTPGATTFKPIAQGTVTVPPPVRSTQPQAFAAPAPTTTPARVYLTIQGLQFPRQGYNIDVLVGKEGAPLEMMKTAANFAIVRNGPQSGGTNLGVTVQVDITEAYLAVNGDQTQLSVALVPVTISSGSAPANAEPLSFKSMSISLVR